MYGSDPPLSAAARAAISDGLSCAAVCQETLAYCLATGGAHAEAARVLLLMDCAALCRLSADLLLRGSELADQACTVGAEAAARCARALTPLAGDPRVQACIEACLRCASSYKQLSAPAAEDYDEVVAETFPASDPPATRER